MRLLAPRASSEFCFVVLGREMGFGVEVEDHFSTPTDCRILLENRLSGCYRCVMQDENYGTCQLISIESHVSRRPYKLKSPAGTYRVGNPA